MARCGCSGATPCNCVVIAGPGIDVSGSGAPGSPYVISATAASDFLVVHDSPTVQLIYLTPDLVANVKLDPDPTQLITATANGLLVTCASVVACVQGAIPAITINELDTPTVNTTVAGAPGGPNFVVSSDVIVSPAAGNALVILGDGLFAPSAPLPSCADVAACLELDPLDTNTVDTTVTGTGVAGSDPWIVSSVVIIDPDPLNKLSATPLGLLVKDPVIQISAQIKLLPAGTAWTPADVTGVLTSVGFSVLSGTADVIDSNGTAAVGLPVSASGEWSAEDANTLLGPQSITAVGGQTMVTWTERP